MQAARLIQVGPRNREAVEYFIATGYAALHSEDLDDAEQLFRQALHLDVRSSSAWRALAATQVGARRAVCLRWAAYVESAIPPGPKPAPIHTPHLPRRLYRLGLMGALSGTALAILLVGSDLAYRERVLPGVVVESMRVGNLTRDAARTAIMQRQQHIARQVITLRAEDRSWRVQLNSLLLDHAAASTAAATEYGHESRFWQRAETRMWAFLGHEYVIDGHSINTVAVQQVAATIATHVNQPRRDAQVVHTEQGWVTIPEQAGRLIDQQQFTTQLTHHLQTHAGHDSNDITVEVETQHDPPQRTAAQVEPIRQHLQQLATQPLTVRSGEQQWVLDRSMLLDANAALVPSELTPSVVAITQQVEAVATAMAAAPQPSRLVREGGRIKQILLGKPGRELDREWAIQVIVTAVANNTPVVDLPTREVPPLPGEVEQLGLVAELGRGESQFLTYSSPERDANVTTGGNDIDGVLLAPGEVFSFTQTVGDITWEKGYRWGEMIEAGIMRPSLGGGICQVSTTAFRAAFWSGLEIVERHNHSWRLPWYEVDAPPGMDATIALGGPDLKFRNNTQHHILIKVETDLDRKRQTVIIYGTPDGRKVDMQASGGGNNSIQRHVTQGTAMIADDVFTSYYMQ